MQKPGARDYSAFNLVRYNMNCMESSYVVAHRKTRLKIAQQNPAYFPNVLLTELIPHR